MTGVSVAEQRVILTCLGCGLACDDVSAILEDGRLRAFEPQCSVGSEWMGTGATASQVLVDGKAVVLEAAVDATAALVARARGRLLVYLGPGCSIEALKPAVALADQLRAVVDTGTTPIAASGILAGQRRGRAAATFGELRNRADVVVLWGVRAEREHSRLLECLVDRVGTHVPAGRAGRTLVAVRIGLDGGHDVADVQLQLGPADELAALSTLRAIVAGVTPAPAGGAGLADLAARLMAARYVAIVAGGETGDPDRSPQRAEGLIALTQLLNTPTRAALFTLRSGDNRNGVESLLTWQTGYPFAVDFRSATPAYAPDERGFADLTRFDAALVVGDWTSIPPAHLTALGNLPAAVIGPGASGAPFAARIAIDTGRLGIHDGGTAYRADDVPISLTPVLTGPRTAVSVLEALELSVRRRTASAA
jgi:formylmethanofuran dehydrogenase subunit B